jgi:mono/diheme cytochrome c family protein
MKQSYASAGKAPRRRVHWLTTLCHSSTSSICATSNITLCEMARSICFVFAASIVVAVATSPGAAERPVHLKPGAGLDKVEANCGVCHSLDYVPMNSPFVNAAGWDAEVSKMISTFGAQIEESDAETISNYLKRNYGRTPPPSRRAPTASAQAPQNDALFPPLLQNKSDERSGSVPKSQ